MKRNSILLLLLGLGAILTVLQCKTCPMCQKEAKEVVKPTVTKSATDSLGFTIKGENGWTVDCPGGQFLKSKSKLIAEETALDDCLTKIGEYQKKYPNQTWLVTGLYGADETNNTIYKNLGEARASKIKKRLSRKYGLKSSLIKIAGKEIGANAFVADTLNNGYQIARGEILKETATKYTNQFDASKPILLRFDTGSSIPKMNSDIRNRFAQLISDLENNPSYNVSVVGHTDTKGDDSANLILGQQRADEIKDYLIRNGIEETRILTTSKGETQPIFATDAENRRVAVSLKK